MPSLNSRAMLELIARTVNIDPSATPNDSKLEQKVIYALKNTAGDAVKASGVLTSTGTAPANNDTVTIGGYTYTCKTTLTGHATATLTVSGNFSNNDTVVVNGKTYTFKTALTPAVNEILIGASASASLDNLKAAVTGGGTPDTDYGAGTTAPTGVTATTKTATTLLFVATASGTTANSYATTETGAASSFGAAAMAGGGTPAELEVRIGDSAAIFLDNLKLAINAGAGAGTVYSEGTEAHPDVTATTNTNTEQTVEARNAGTEGNSIATTESSTQLSWAAATLEGGAAGTYYKGETRRSEAQVSGGANI